MRNKKWFSQTQNSFDKFLDKQQQFSQACQNYFSTQFYYIANNSSSTFKNNSPDIQMNTNYSKSLVLNFSSLPKSSHKDDRNISLPHYSIVFKSDSSRVEETLKSTRINKSTQLTSNKPYNPRILELSKPNKTHSPQNNTMVWIGVTKKKQDLNIENYQAFPKRNKKTADQSYHNFMLKYGKVLKQPKQSRDTLKIYNSHTYSFTNAATTKVKPRLTWYGKTNNPNKYFLSRNSMRKQSSANSPIKSRQNHRSIFTSSGNKSVLEFNNDEFDGES